MPRQFYTLLSVLCFDLEIFCCLTDGSVIFGCCKSRARWCSQACHNSRPLDCHQYQDKSDLATPVRIQGKPILWDQFLQKACEIVAQNMHHDDILTWVGGRLPSRAAVVLTSTAELAPTDVIGHAACYWRMPKLRTWSSALPTLLAYTRFGLHPLPSLWLTQAVAAPPPAPSLESHAHTSSAG